MEAVFEAYVAKTLRTLIKEGFYLRTQASAQKLVTHCVDEKEREKRDIFPLKPDLMIEKGNESICVLDTNWKPIDLKSQNNNVWVWTKVPQCQRQIDPDLSSNRKVQISN